MTPTRRRARITSSERTGIGNNGRDTTMTATASFTGRYIKPVEGHAITPNVLGKKRMAIIVDDADYRRWADAGYGGEGTTVTDLITGSEWTLARADCGAGCMCATKVVAS